MSYAEAHARGEHVITPQIGCPTCGRNRIVGGPRDPIERRVGPPHPGMIGAIPPSWVDRRRAEPAGFRHNEVAVLSAFAEAVIRLQSAVGADSDRAADHARAAVRAARMLTVRDEYR